MKNLQEATEKICELKGNLVALDALITALLQHLPAQSRAQLTGSFSANAEVARTVLLHAPVSEVTLAAFERDVSRISVFIERAAPESVVEDNRPIQR